MVNHTFPMPNAAAAARYNNLKPKYKTNVHKTYSLVKECEAHGGIALYPLAKACGYEPGSYAFSYAKQFLQQEGGLKGKFKNVVDPATGNKKRLKFFYFDIEP